MQSPPAPAEVSIVIVCMNMLAALKETLESVFALSGVNIRLYVVDGASRDGTPDHLAACSSRLAGWVSERDTGIYDAMNKGWNMTADNSYVLYLGAGDKIISLPSPTTLADDLAAGTFVVIGTCHIGPVVFRSGWTPQLQFSNTAHHQALLIHKSVCPRSPFDVSLRVYGDWDFNVRLFNRNLAARYDEDFITYAEPGGVSARHDLPEIVRVAWRHGGPRVALRSLLKNLKAELKLRLRPRPA